MKTRMTAALCAWIILGTVACHASDPDEPRTAAIEGRSQASRDDEASASTARTSPAPGEHGPFGQAPNVPTGPLAPEVSDAIETAFGPRVRTSEWDEAQLDALLVIGESGDVRVAWILSDLIRFTTDPGLNAFLSTAAIELMGLDIDVRHSWRSITDHLIAWDVAAPPGYLKVKRGIYTLIVPQWERIFQPGDIDWRHLTWGGVGIDDRAFGTTDEPCHCIPAADNPEVTDVDGAGWLEDDDVVFGVVVGGESRAYPRRIMEVREMVNDTLGGRDLGIPYCTLCGSAQAYFTDEMPEGVERPVLRTSGLLIRSNKVMYDLNTFSVFDTFRGNAVTGPLAERGIVLGQAGVVTTTWGQWRAAHPETTVLVERLALGHDFDFRNGRDANGPIFPIGDVDERLPVQEDVLGLLTESGKAVAFPVQTALEALARGETVAFENVRLVLDGGGVRAVDAEGDDLGGHQAFWFAWSQFHPDTELWSR